MVSLAPSLGKYQWKQSTEHRQASDYHDKCVNERVDSSSQHPINGCECEIKWQNNVLLFFFYPVWNRNEGKRIKKKAKTQKKPSKISCSTYTLRSDEDKSRFGTDLGLWLRLKTMFFFVTQVWWISQGWKSQKMCPGINHAPAFCFWSKWALHSVLTHFQRSAPVLRRSSQNIHSKASPWIINLCVFAN